MTPILRFRLWVVCVLGIWVGAPLAMQPANYVGPLGITAVVIYLVSYFGLVALLQSTPADAIRLPPGRSVALITAGTGWLYLACFGGLLSTEVGLIAGAIAASLAFGVSRLLVARNLPAWSATVIMWCPCFVYPGCYFVNTAVELVGIALVLLAGLVIRPR